MRSSAATIGRSRWPAARSTRWPTAASTTSWAAASRATRPTRSGSCRTSRRCSTTTRQLARVYVHAWQVTGERRYLDVALDTLDFMVRDLLTPDGAFAASLDADTDGVEGATYVWTRQEIDGAPGREAPLRECLRRDGERQLGGPRHPRGVGATPRSGRSTGCRMTRSPGGSRRRATPSGCAPAAAAAGPRRQGARRMERPCHRGLRRRGSRPSASDDVTLAERGRLRGGSRDRGRRRSSRPGGRGGGLRRSWKDGRASQAGVLEDYTHLADGCSRCTRRPSTSAGSWRLAS